MRMRNRTRKRKAAVAMVLLAAMLLGGCGNQKVDPEPAMTEAPAATPSPTPEPTPTPSPTPEPTPTPDPYTYEDEIASVYGYLNNRSEASLHNIELIVEKLDGTKIQPGEVFSFNEAVGPTTAENGFEEAEVYASYPDDEVYREGGGASLVASVIYCSALYGALTPVERTQHYYWINADSYLRWGCDAYVCNDGVNDVYDMKISNPFPTAVMLKLRMDRDEEKLWVDIFGANPDGVYGVPKHNLTSYYLEAADWVCDRFINKMSRDVYNNAGWLRTDDLNEFDFGIDGDVYYHRHPNDYVW